VYCAGEDPESQGVGTHTSVGTSVGVSTRTGTDTRADAGIGTGVDTGIGTGADAGAGAGAEVFQVPVVNCMTLMIDAGFYGLLQYVMVYPMILASKLFRKLADPGRKETRIEWIRF
jgi:hypothetical protein